MQVEKDRVEGSDKRRSASREIVRVEKECE